MVLLLTAIAICCAIYLAILTRKRRGEKKEQNNSCQRFAEPSSTPAKESPSQGLEIGVPRKELRLLPDADHDEPKDEVELRPDSEPGLHVGPSKTGVQSEHADEELHDEVETESREEERSRTGETKIRPCVEPFRALDAEEKLCPGKPVCQPDESLSREKDDRRLKARARSTPREPAKRGGRPRGSLKDPESHPADESLTPGLKRPRPEIVCWKKGFEWILGVEVPDEILAQSGLMVVQNDSPLENAEDNSACMILKQINGSMKVVWNENGIDESFEIELGEDKWLLFKLSGDNRGRRVKHPTAGSYLVVVQNGWRRDEDISGPPPIAPESVRLIGFLGHFFDLGKESDRRIAFRTPENTQVVLELNASRFELVGSRLEDANEDNGPLFSDKPPCIRAADAEAWTEIGTIVVGEEGPDPGRWRMAFTPNPHDLEQDLPPEVATTQSGWYFIRFYDPSDVLVESLDFRLATGLRAIKVLGHPPLPSETGHGPVLVEIVHDPSCSFLPAATNEGSIAVATESHRTSLTIPPDQKMDRTCWLAGSRDGKKAQVIIQVERIWWAVGNDNEAPTVWSDKRINLLRRDFTATSNKAIWIRLPRLRWVNAVRVGFGDEKLRRYPVKVTENSVVLPFREFGEDIDDRTNEHRFLISIERHGSAINAEVGSIPPDVQDSPSHKTAPAEPQPINSEKATLLYLHRMSLPHLASALTQLRRGADGSLARLIKEVRKRYPTRSRKREPDPFDFMKTALCVLALSLEVGRDKLPQRLDQKWRIRARRAAQTFPEIVDALRSRYLELNAGRVCRSRRVHNRRTSA